MKTKLITLAVSAVLAASLLALTACGTTDESAVSSAVESSVISETSASLGIYIQDTDSTPGKVVDRYGNDLSELYILKEDGIYEGETLILPMENTQVYVPVTEIAFTVENKTVHPENSFTLDLVILPEDATCKEVDLTTDNTEVLKIENGEITALANGEATITATAKAGGATATCLIIVNAEVEETETQNEEAATSGGTIHSSNTNSTTANTNTHRNNTAVNNQTTTGNTNTGNTNTGTTTPPQQQQQTVAPAQPQPTVHQPIYRQQWVVDQAAWSEEVPVWGNKEIAVCNTCGADISGFAGQHTKEHTLAGEGGSWRSEVIKVQTGTKTIFHEEQGHYENILVCGGCTGTH